MGLNRDHHRYSKRITRTKRWKALRAQIIERDGFRCRSCGCGGRLEVDHVHPVRTHPELSYDPANLQALCSSCHTRKTRVECGHKPRSPGATAWDLAVEELEQAAHLRRTEPASLITTENLAREIRAECPSSQKSGDGTLLQEIAAPLHLKKGKVDA